MIISFIPSPTPLHTPTHMYAYINNTRMRACVYQIARARYLMNHGEEEKRLEAERVLEHDGGAFFSKVNLIDKVKS